MTITQRQLLRLRKNIGTVELAKRLGVHRQTIWEWINGRHKPHGAAVKMVEVLNERLNGNGSHTEV